MLDLSEFLVDHRNNELCTVLGKDYVPFEYGSNITAQTARNLEKEITQLCNHSIGAYAQQSGFDLIYYQAISNAQDMSTPFDYSLKPGIHSSGLNPLAPFRNPLSNLTDLANAYIIQAHFDGKDSPYTRDELKTITYRSNNIR